MNGREIWVLVVCSGRGIWLAGMRGTQWQLSACSGNKCETRTLERKRKRKCKY